MDVIYYEIKLKMINLNHNLEEFFESACFWVSLIQGYFETHAILNHSQTGKTCFVSFVVVCVECYGSDCGCG